MIRVARCAGGWPDAPFMKFGEPLTNTEDISGLGLDGSGHRCAVKPVFPTQRREKIGVTVVILHRLSTLIFADVLRVLEIWSWSERPSPAALRLSCANWCS